MFDVNQVLDRIKRMNPDEAASLLRKSLDAAGVPYQTEVGDVEFEELFPDFNYEIGTFYTEIIYENTLKSEGHTFDVEFSSSYDVSLATVTSGYHLTGDISAA